MEALLRFLTRRAGWVLAAVFGLTLFTASRIVDFRTGEARLFIDPSVNSLLSADDDDRKLYDHVRRLFGSSEMLLVAVHDEGGIFTASRLRSIQRITERIEQVEGVHHVVSLANALNIRGVGDDLQLETFLDTIPEDPASLLPCSSCFPLPGHRALGGARVASMTGWNDSPASTFATAPRSCASEPRWPSSASWESARSG